MRFACISDIHLSDDFGKDERHEGHEYLDEWFGALAEDGNVEHVIIAGDVLGKYEDPRDSLDFGVLRGILNDHGWNDGRYTSLVPGNHDVRRAGNIKTIARGLYHHLPKLYGGPVLDGPYYFPFVKRLPGVHVIGLDTASNWDRRLHSGALGDDQLDELDRLLRRPRIRDGHVILAMHHPPRNNFFASHTGDLYDADDFWEVVDSSNVDLIICGHDHRSFEDEENNVPIVGVGGFMHGDSDALIVDAGEGSLQYFWWNAWSATDGGAL